MINANKAINEFDFYKSFKHPIKRNSRASISIFKYIPTAILLIGLSMAIFIGTTLYSKQTQIHEIMLAENTRISKNINEFVLKNPTNVFVFKTYNECSKIIKGSAETIANECQIYVLNTIEHTPKDLHLDKKKVYQSLQELKKLAQYSPEANQKLNKLFADLGVPEPK